jgi:hypothetical protein
VIARASISNAPIVEEDEGIYEREKREKEKEIRECGVRV